MIGVSLPSFQLFILLVQIGQKFLAFIGYSVRFCLDYRILFDSFSRLNNNLRFHVDLSVLIFHHDNSWLVGNFCFYLLLSHLISRLLSWVIRSVWSSVEAGWGSWMECIYKVINGSGQIGDLTEKRGELELLWRLSFDHVKGG